jgi:hypothetical protein
VHRTGVIARYLDWRTAMEEGPPARELRAQYGRLLIRSFGRCWRTTTRRPGTAAATAGLGQRSRLGHAGAHHADAVTGLPVRGQGAIYGVRSVPAAPSRLGGRAVATAGGLASRKPRCAASTAGAAVRAGCQGVTRMDTTAPILSIEVGLRHRVVQQERRPHLFTETEVSGYSIPHARSRRATCRCDRSRCTP